VVAVRIGVDPLMRKERRPRGSPNGHPARRRQNGFQHSDDEWVLRRAGYCAPCLRICREVVLNLGLILEFLEVGVLKQLHRVVQGVWMACWTRGRSVPLAGGSRRGACRWRSDGLFPGPARGITSVNCPGLSLLRRHRPGSALAPTPPQSHVAALERYLDLQRSSCHGAKILAVSSRLCRIWISFWRRIVGALLFAGCRTAARARW